VTENSRKPAPGDRAAGKVGSLYVHVPFCARKCSYCAFYSEPSSGELIDRYVQALVRELELAAPDLKPLTVFFGGGTPSLLNLRQWEQVLRAMDRLGLLGAREWTVECNPATVSLDKARLLKAFGVNRISMGVQSLDEALLERLGRVHDRKMVFKSFDLLRQAGFDNLNLDLMFAIPGQTLEVWRQTLTEAVAMQSEHLSCYEVIYEEDTPLFHQLRAGKIDHDEDLACLMYDELVASATRAGFRQYEVANFARDLDSPASSCSCSCSPFETAPQLGSPPPEFDIGPLHLPRFACRHNVNYWRGGSFCGLGPSATSYVQGLRTKNWANTQLYCEQLERGRRAIESREELSPIGRAGETAAFGLRMVAGWPLDQFRRITGYDLARDWADAMGDLVRKDWATITPDRLALTPLGLRFADAAAQLFLR
jgi:coproporphyrinogen III oxidase-like Fe-S oxidoreductase